MRRMIFFSAVVMTVLFGPRALGQTDPLVGRWEGKTDSPQGERPTSAVFKKEATGYSGTVNVLNRDAPLKDIKVDGKKVTAQATVDTPQAAVAIKYDLVLDGDNLNGKGEVDFGGQTFSFDVTLKRAAAGAAAAPPAGAAPAAGAQAQQGGGQAQGAGQQRAPSPPQPMQKQSADYFVGTWNVKVVGRESALGVAPRAGTMTFTKNANGSLTGRGSSTHEGGTLQEDISLTFDEATKMLTVAEKRSNGIQLRSRGDWTSPISIRFTFEPIKAGRQSLNLKRTISVISPYSFSVVEELSEDGGPLVRLSSALYSKAGAN